MPKLPSKPVRHEAYADGDHEGSVLRGCFDGESHGIFDERRMNACGIWADNVDHGARSACRSLNCL